MSRDPSATTRQTGVTASAHGIDPALIAACIILARVIVGALLAGACAVYSLRRNAQLERQSQEEQFQPEQEM